MEAQWKAKGEIHKAEMKEAVKKMRWYDVIVAVWPVILVPIGGAIGGGLGGMAIVLNFRVFAKPVPTTTKYLYCFLIGVGSIILWIVIGMLLITFFPGVFKK